jgi:hypothetical protein
MIAIVFPAGEGLSRPTGEFLLPHWCYEISSMKTVEETRRDRLKMLVEQHGGEKNGMANLCEALGLARNNTAGLTRILNANLRHDRDGEAYELGSKKAREIESKLRLAVGWMDTPTSLAVQFGGTGPIDKLAEILAVMEPEMQCKVVRMVAALNEPANGTNGPQH